MRTTTIVLSLAFIFAANGCGSSSGGSTGTAGKGSAGSSGTAGSGTAGSGSAGTTGTAGASDAGTAGSGTAGASDAGTAGSGTAGASDAGTAGSSDGGAGADASDGSVMACGASTEANIGVGCNTVDATGPCVVPTVGTGTTPMPAGGAITGGTYDLTAFTVYATSDAAVQAGNQPPRRGTLAIPASTTGTFSIQLTQSTGATTERQAGSVVVTGSEVMFTPTCPPPGDAGDNGGSAGFTATATTFTLFEVGGNGSLQVNVYTKR